VGLFPASGRNETNARLPKSVDISQKRKQKPFLGIKCALISLAHTQFAEKDRKTFICKCVTMIDLASNWFKIHQYDDEQSLSQILPKRNGFPDTLGQHKSLVIVAQNSLDMSSRRC
jgi:hypothetical protein